MVLVRVLETRYDYPPIEGTDRPRYAAVGDLIHVTEEQAAELLAYGRVERYE